LAENWRSIVSFLAGNGGENMVEPAVADAVEDEGWLYREAWKGGRRLVEESVGKRVACAI
jgi:hypothetical protein